jgi:hypothetical protein
MKNLLPLTCSMVAVLALTACYSGPPRRTVVQTTTYDTSSRAYDGYYDGHYGPYSSGHWNNDGYFYYRDSTSNSYRRDDARHFRRESFQGGTGVHVDGTVGNMN